MLSDLEADSLLTTPLWPCRFERKDDHMVRLSKAERMEIRRATGNRALPEPYIPPIHRGAVVLWPHACFQCRKSWKLTEETNAKCPECSGELRPMGRAFKVPKKSDKEQWAKVEALWRAGFRFVNHDRWQKAEPFPERLREVDDFIQRNPDHPFRVKF